MDQAASNMYFERKTPTFVLVLKNGHKTKTMVFNQIQKAEYFYSTKFGLSLGFYTFNVEPEDLLAISEYKYDEIELYATEFFESEIDGSMKMVERAPRTFHFISYSYELNGTDKARWEFRLSEY